MDGLDVRLLGPVELWCDRAQLPPINAQQRTVLATLALEPDALIPLNRLITALWGDTPPAYARNIIQGHVSKLRRALTDRPDVVLTTAGCGYRLTMAPLAIDLHRFRALRGRAHDTSPADARGLLQQALALWRGPSFADVAGDWLPQTIGSALEQERLSATEELAVANLALGNIDEVATAMTDTITQHPLREKSIGLLMSALHQTRRRGEALALFRDTRRRFVDELGIEPGGELQRIHREILADEPVRTRGLTPQRTDRRTPPLGHDTVGDAAAEGLAHLRRGDHRRAVVCYQRAVADHQAAGERLLQAEALSQLSEAYYGAADVVAAHTALTQAVRILAELHYPLADALRHRLRQFY